MSSTDTIFALATPPGKSGVAVLRLSGSQALASLKRLTGLPQVRPRHAHYVTFTHPETKATLDRGLALYFPAPHSFTGEEVVEFQLHGSIAVFRQFQTLLAGMEGLRPAEPGEFTRRAFANGRIDLMEAEGLADLIDAQTTRQQEQALRQMQGELSHFYDDVRVRIVGLLALLEAYIDFPDEDIPEEVLSQMEEGTRALQADISTALADAGRGERLRDGFNVVILGAPNVGKSSLLNLLAKREAAIVSQKAGTTRDAIEIHMDICGYPVVLVDTAGIRESDEEIEAEGIRRALARAASADIRLVLFDGTQTGAADASSIQLIDDNTLVIINKCDSEQVPIPADLPASCQPIRLSVKSGQGVEALLQALEYRISNYFSEGNSTFITRSRHRALLQDASDCLGRSLAKLPLELKCEELRLSALSAGKITGKIQVDDVLDVVFKSFCIGK